MSFLVSQPKDHNTTSYVSYISKQFNNKMYKIVYKVIKEYENKMLIFILMKLRAQKKCILTIS